MLFVLLMFLCCFLGVVVLGCVVVCVLCDVFVFVCLLFVLLFVCLLACDWLFCCVLFSVICLFGFAWLIAVCAVSFIACICCVFVLSWCFVVCALFCVSCLFLFVFCVCLFAVWFVVRLLAGLRLFVSPCVCFACDLFVFTWLFAC